MDADDIVKQGKEFAEKLRHNAGEQVARNEQKIKSTIGKLVNFVNEKTDHKYAEQVNKAATFATQGVDRLAAEAPERSGPDPAAPKDTPQPDQAGDQAGPEGTDRRAGGDTPSAG